MRSLRLPSRQRAQGTSFCASVWARLLRCCWRAGSLGTDLRRAPFLNSRPSPTCNPSWERTYPHTPRWPPSGPLSCRFSFLSSPLFRDFNAGSTSCRPAPSAYLGRGRRRCRFQYGRYPSDTGHQGPSNWSSSSHLSSARLSPNKAAQLSCFPLPAIRCCPLPPLQTAGHVIPTRWWCGWSPRLSAISRGPS